MFDLLHKIYWVWNITVLFCNQLRNCWIFKVLAHWKVVTCFIFFKVLYYDGIPYILFLCRSSNKDLWPIQCTILELPVDLRKKNIIMPALWFSKCKVKMELLLQPLVEELELLATEGKICHMCALYQRLH
jgi:hypothetical protein